MGNLSYHGKPTGIIYGFLKKILTLAAQFKTSDFIFCWDAGVTHRHQAYSDYKKDRHTDMTLTQQEDRQDMLAQAIELRMKALPSAGFRNSYIQHLYEADDLIAHWANRLKDSRYVVIVSTDSDLYQLLDDYCDIWNPAQKRFITRGYFKERYGVEPDQWAMAKAIGGCAADNVKGIEGISDPKFRTSKALKYLRGELTKGKVFDRITSEEGQKIIARNLPLVTVPYKEDKLKRMIRRRNEFTRTDFIRVFDKYHFKSFLEKDNFARWKKFFIEGGSDADKVNGKARRTINRRRRTITRRRAQV